MDRIVIVTKETDLERLVREYHTEGSAEFALSSRGKSILPYRQEDTAYQAALGEVARQIPGDIPVTYARRSDLPRISFRDTDLVIVVGPDGLFVNAAQYLKDQPVLAVNPDPRSVAGVLMRFPPREVGRTISRVQAGTHALEPLPFIRAGLEDGRTLFGINDIFLGRRDHVSARYEITWEGVAERQSSSGIIVSTGIGSSGWMRSVRAMLEGIVGTGHLGKLSDMPEPESEELVFVVREPFPSPGLGTSIVTGRITPGEALVVRSEMPKGGCLFSDGVVEKAIEWKAGSAVSLTVGDRYVQRIVP